MRPHLLAAISLTVGQDENLLDFEAYLFCNLGKDDVHGDAGPRVTNVIVDHDERRARLQHTCTLGNHTGHFVKITAHHARNAVVV